MMQSRPSAIEEEIAEALRRLPADPNVQAAAQEQIREFRRRVVLAGEKPDAVAVARQIRADRLELLRRLRQLGGDQVEGGAA